MFHSNVDQIPFTTMQYYLYSTNKPINKVKIFTNQRIIEGRIHYTSLEKTTLLTIDLQQKLVYVYIVENVYKNRFS